MLWLQAYQQTQVILIDVCLKQVITVALTNLT